MPFKNLEKRKEYKRLWIAKKRRKQKVEPCSVEPLKSVEPISKMSNPELVEPKINNVEPMEAVEPQKPLLSLPLLKNVEVLPIIKKDYHSDGTVKQIHGKFASVEEVIKWLEQKP